MRVVTVLRRHQLLLLYALLFALPLTGCSSLGSKKDAATSPPKLTSLPVATLRAMAMDIEAQIKAGNREPNLENREGIVLDAPEIVQAVRTRAARAELISKFLDSGHGWERRRGTLWIIRSVEYKVAGTRRTRDIDALTVNSENLDRRALYGGIIKQSGLPSKYLSEVEEIFFEARVALMKPGQKYEGTDGETLIKE